MNCPKLKEGIKAMAAQEIKPPRCKCGAWSELHAGRDGFTVKCPSCGRTGKLQDTAEYAIGAFLSTMYATENECFIGCLLSELPFELSDEAIDSLRQAAETHSLNDLQHIAREEIRRHKES